MSDASRSAPDRRRDAPAWPPYVARTDDEADVFALDAHPQPPAPLTAVVAWQPPSTARHGRAQAWSSTQVHQEPRDLCHDKTHGPGAPTQDGFRGVPAEGNEVLFADFDPAARRAISHRPIIALTVNALGYHLFVSHAARRLLGRLLLIGLGVLLALLWGDLTDVAELLLGVFAH